MKIFYSLVLVAVVVGCVNSTCIKQGISARGVFENIINSTLEAVKNKISDPLAVEDITLDLADGTLLKGGANVTNLRISGIQSLVATAIKVNVLKLRVDMTLGLTELIVTAKYWGDLLLAKLVPLYGEGRVSAVLDEVTLQISAAANLTGGISLKNTEVELTLGEAVIDLHGLLNNEEFSALVSTVLNDNLADFINNNQGVISTVISGVVETIINAILQGNSIKSYEEYLEDYISC